jgi:serine/threonine protein kinase
MLCGRFPFKGKDTKDLYKQIAKGAYQFPELLQVSSEAKQLLLKMLVVNPAGRFTAA